MGNLQTLFHNILGDAGNRQENTVYIWDNISNERMFIIGARGDWDIINDIYEVEKKSVYSIRSLEDIAGTYFVKKGISLSILLVI